MDVNTAASDGLKLRAILLLLLLCACAAKPTAATVVRQDVHEALLQASASKQPLLLFYSAPWCGACRAMNKVLQTPKVAQALGDTMVIKIEVDEHLSAQEGLPAHLQPKSLQLNAVPTLLWLCDGGVGAQSATLKGYVGQERLIDWLSQHNG